MNEGQRGTLAARSPRPNARMATRRDVLEVTQLHARAERDVPGTRQVRQRGAFVSSAVDSITAPPIERSLERALYSPVLMPFR